MDDGTPTSTGHIGETDDVWDNEFYTNGLIYNFSVNVLVDSGSTASVITTDMFEKLPSNLWCLLVPIKSEISDVNGNNVSSIGFVTLDIKLGQEISSQTFLVCTISQDGILGQDFLLKQVSKVNYKRMVFHTHNNNEIQCWIGGNANMICRVEVKNTVKIPPMTSLMLAVEIPGSEYLTETGYVEGKLKKHPNQH